jgi:hypothetical protein
MVKIIKKSKPPVPEVQSNGYGWFGSKVLKKKILTCYIYREPVQFAGFKLFYKMTIKNDWNVSSQSVKF